MHTAIGSGSRLRLARSKASAQMPAVVELDAGAAAAGQLQAMVGRVVGPGIGIAHDHDPGGDEAAGIGRGVVQGRQHARKVDPVGVDVLLDRRLLHQHRRLRRAERAADEGADAVEVDPEGGLAILPAAQQVSDHRQIVAVNGGEQQRRAAVELLHDRRHLKVRIDRCGIGVKPPLLRHALERGAKTGIEHPEIGHGQGLSMRKGPAWIAASCKLARSVTMAKPRPRG